MTKTGAAVIRAAMEWSEKQDAYLRAESGYPMRQLLRMDGALVKVKRACHAHAQATKGKRK